jgi:uncharacterized protein
MSQMELLTESIKAGDADRVSEILDREPDLTNLMTAGGASPLLLALYYGHRNIAHLMVDRGHVLSIHEAAAYGDLVRVRALIEAEPELTDRVSPDGHLPLGLACFFLNAEVVNYLVEKGTDVNAASQNSQRVTPLHAAAASQSVSIARSLLEHGADANARQNSGFTALHSAAQNGQLQMIQLLLEHGGQPALKADNGKTPFDVALENGQLEAAQFLSPAEKD